MSITALAKPPTTLLDGRVAMDRLAKLDALNGWGVGEKREEKPTKPLDYDNVTNSDDDEYVTSGRAAERGKKGASKEQGIAVLSPPFTEYATLKCGQLAPEGEEFMALGLVKKYPWLWIGKRNQDRVATRFFDGGKFLNQIWDQFYVYPEPNRQPSILVPTKQFTQFLKLINNTLHTDLSIPSGGGREGFYITFTLDGTPYPRYLGRSTDPVMAGSLSKNVPPAYYKPADEEWSPIEPSDAAVANSLAKMDLIRQSQKARKTAKKEKNRKDHLGTRKSWGDQTKRVQRYHGLREIRKGLHQAKLAGLEDKEWEAYDIAVQEGAFKTPALTFQPDSLPPFSQESNVVFVAIDVEAWEKDHNTITEIGVATLDTTDISAAVPGEGGANWMSLIRAEHFRINEHKHFTNGEHVTGCADRFEFGQVFQFPLHDQHTDYGPNSESEFINLKDAPHVIANCFKHPFSGKRDENASNEEPPKRNIVLVGHDLDGDIRYLRKIGYDVSNLSLHDQIDTARMWQYLNRNDQLTKLVVILSELNLVNWNVHNAGNDAVYTLHAMIGIAVKDLVDRAKRRDQKTAPHSKEGWSSAGDSDGGAPIKPALPDSKKSSRSAAKPSEGWVYGGTSKKHPGWGFDKAAEATGWGDGNTDATGWGAAPGNNSWTSSRTKNIGHGPSTENQWVMSQSVGDGQWGSSGGISNTTGWGAEPGNNSWSALGTKDIGHGPSTGNQWVANHSAGDVQWGSNTNGTNTEADSDRFSLISALKQVQDDVSSLGIHPAEKHSIADLDFTSSPRLNATADVKTNDDLDHRNAEVAEVLAQVDAINRLVADLELQRSGVGSQMNQAPTINTPIPPPASSTRGRVASGDAREGGLRGSDPDSTGPLVFPEKPKDGDCWTGSDAE
ncbi:hypothetical protein G7Y89_g12439 [Cudoniella acicularis]|uniref:Gfd2/YDR514C-like C-terminal domain-containing protein n=1 Tax=Cudoniella acicularis TaxID=354080 RepID=A0A8H4VZ61_9HELO|nr:hypothetical protein G7Y89_g12439 [Cudoniella acicularis]